MWAQIQANQRRSAFLVVGMALVLFLLGYALGELVAPGGGRGGILVAFVVWAALSLFSYFSGDRVFLGLSGAKKIKHSDHPELFNVVEEMKIAAGLPKTPDIYIIDDPAPNAFATGRSPQTASVAVTAGLLEQCTRDELQGVIGHEIGHVHNRDILYMTMVGVMMGTIVLLADIGIRSFFYGGRSRRSSSRSNGGGQMQLVLLVVAIVLMILAPILAQLLYFAISRKREYLADASSVQFTRYPEGLARALEKISHSSQRLRSANRVMAPLYIANPLKVTKRGLADLTSTHPPISERIRILRAMTGGAGVQSYDQAFRKVTGKSAGVIPTALSAVGGSVAIRQPAAPDTRTPLDRTRETNDLLWKLHGYQIISCACGTKLKVPKAYAGKALKCPHCGREHQIQ